MIVFLGYHPLLPILWRVPLEECGANGPGGIDSRRAKKLVFLAEEHLLRTLEGCWDQCTNALSNLRRNYRSIDAECTKSSAYSRL